MWLNYLGLVDSRGLFRWATPTAILGGWLCAKVSWLGVPVLAIGIGALLLEDWLGRVRREHQELVDKALSQTRDIGLEVEGLRTQLDSLRMDVERINNRPAPFPVRR